MKPPPISIDPDFPPLPATPSKPPIPKRLKPNQHTDEGSYDIVEKISQVINNRADGLEKMITNNTMHIEGLKRTIDFVCAEIRDIKAKVTVNEKRISCEEKRVTAAEQRIAELEAYSRRWNLRLYGVPEAEKEENAREETINICQAVLPEHKSKLPDVIDSVHRLGRRKKDNSKPRGIILQFTSRVYRDAVWKAAKKSAYLRDKGLRFAEDLSKGDREKRNQLWPFVEKARREGKVAYFIGGRAFANGAEITLPV